MMPTVKHSYMASSVVSSQNDIVFDGMSTKTLLGQPYFVQWLINRCLNTTKETDHQAAPQQNSTTSRLCNWITPSALTPRLVPAMYSYKLYQPSRHSSLPPTHLVLPHLLVHLAYLYPSSFVLITELTMQISATESFFPSISSYSRHVFE